MESASVAVGRRARQRARGGARRLLEAAMPARDPAGTLPRRRPAGGELGLAGLLPLAALAAAGLATARSSTESGAAAATEALTLFAVAALAPIALLAGARAPTALAALLAGVALAALPHLGVLRLAAVPPLVSVAIALVAARELDPRRAPPRPASALAIAFAAQLVARGVALWFAPAAPATWLELVVLPASAGAALVLAAGAAPGAAGRATAVALAAFVAGPGFTPAGVGALAALAAVERSARSGPRLRLVATGALALLPFAAAAEPAWLALAVAAAAVTAAGAAPPLAHAARTLLLLLALATALAAAPPWARRPAAASALSALGAARPLVLERPVDNRPVVLSAAAPRFETALSGEPVGGWVIDSYLVESAALPCGRRLATVTLEGGEPVPLTLGRDSGEWASDRADVAATLTCPPPPPWTSWVPAEGRFFGHHYRSRARLATPRAAHRLVVERDPTLPPGVTIALFQVATER